MLLNLHVIQWISPGHQHVEKEKELKYHLEEAHEAYQLVGESPNQPKCYRFFTIMLLVVVREILKN
jgi:hypothetical protein